MRIGSTSWLIAAADVFGNPVYEGESKAVFSLRKKKRDESKGWLRRLEAARSSSPSIKGHLAEVDRRKALSLLFAIQANMRAVPLVAFAWGVSKQTIYDLRTNALASNDMATARKTRKDRANRSSLQRLDELLLLQLNMPTVNSSGRRTKTALHYPRSR
jgi:hypothetical protein